MRWAFGLVSLLVVVALMAYLFSQTSIPTARQGNAARKQAEALTGRGPDGQPAGASIQLQPTSVNGQTNALVVTDITAGGAMEQYYGLKKGDEIIKIGDMKPAEWGGDDLAIALVQEAAQRRFTLTIRRAGQILALDPHTP